MSHPIPSDLVRAQREWNATYGQLAGQPGRTALRRRLLLLSRALMTHPYWTAETWTPAVRMELRRLARADTAG
ncbi:hypothetical protein ACFVYF_06680 [Streptomyces sp. NPDC058274]|jgi:hypothetical protein|uniref:hypothetical protein n=1 Tax=Streptomyces sp. NPDC058274 TaxID=3346416 RepID=UPI0036EC573C